MNKERLIWARMEADQNLAEAQPVLDITTDAERRTDTFAGKSESTLENCLQTATRHKKGVNPAAAVQRYQGTAGWEAAERQAEREYLPELARLNVQNAVCNPGKTKPRCDQFPMLEEDGDLDTFLRAFEKICRHYALEPSEWACYLTPRLTGKVLEALVNLPQELDRNYPATKEALLKRFKLTPETYRRKFRDSKRSPSDTYADLLAHLSTMMHRWIDGLQVTDFDKLKDLILQEQFLALCPAELKIWVRDRDPKTSEEAASLADKYIETRVPVARKPLWISGKERHPGGPPTTKPAAAAPFGGMRGKPVLGNTRRCFNCNMVGHISANCPSKKKSTSLSVGGTAGKSVPAVLCAGRPPGETTGQYERSTSLRPGNN